MYFYCRTMDWRRGDKFLRDFKTPVSRKERRGKSAENAEIKKEFRISQVMFAIIPSNHKTKIRFPFARFSYRDWGRFCRLFLRG